MPYRYPIRFSESVEHRLLFPRDSPDEKMRLRFITKRLNLMSSLVTLSNAIRFTSSIIKDEFRDRKGATWKKNGIPIKRNRYRGIQF